MTAIAKQLEREAARRDLRYYGLQQWDIADGGALTELIVAGEFDIAAVQTEALIKIAIEHLSDDELAPILHKTKRCPLKRDAR